MFKRRDKLEESDYPAVAVFFAEPDVLPGLFALANYAYGANSEATSAAILAHS